MNKIIKLTSFCAIIFLVMASVAATNKILPNQINGQDYVSFYEQYRILKLSAQTHQNLPPELRQRMDRMANGGSGSSSFLVFVGLGLYCLLLSWGLS